MVNFLTVAAKHCRQAEHPLQLAAGSFKCKFAAVLLVMLCVALFTCSQAFSQENQNTLAASAPKKLTLAEAVMCEKIDGLTPESQGIVFSIALGRVSCFTSFDPVPEDTYVYHSWFFRDKLSTRIKLSLQPPRWSTFSSIQLREADQGPWRVEITDREGRLLRLLRFSITD
jgi:hypothetical protein